jgi:hypothetical protein
MPSRFRTLVNREAIGALLLAGSVRFLFLHERYQPGSASMWARRRSTCALSDGALLVVVLAAAVVALRHGLDRLRPAKLLWIPGIALLA